MPNYLMFSSMEDKPRGAFNPLVFSLVCRGHAVIWANRRLWCSSSEKILIFLTNWFKLYFILHWGGQSVTDGLRCNAHCFTLIVNYWKC